MNVDEIMQSLDRWVSQCGNGEYVSRDYCQSHDLSDQWSIPPDWGIQQVESEIREFVELLLERSIRGKALELGLGHYGGTHFLWRFIFDHVTSIELHPEKIRTFDANTRKFDALTSGRCHGKRVLDDGKSSFLFGDTSDPRVVEKTYKFLGGGGVDLLFIDAGHQYHNVLTDWVLYAPLVRPGGIVAFHDAVSPVEGSGVPQFLEQLRGGQIMGCKYDLETICDSRYGGIAFYEAC